MHLSARLSDAQGLLPLRTHFREEMNCQIVKDSIHARDGWTRSYLLELDGAAVGFGSVAIAGPWKDKPTLIEFYLLPEQRARAFEYFERLVVSGDARFFEAQTNDALATAMVLAYARDIQSEAIVFADKLTTQHSVAGAGLRRLTEEKEIRECQELRRGGGEWALELGRKVVGKGGFLFHYNRPYADIYMEVNEGFRRRGLGSYLVQELKRECYQFGAVPCARCNTTNLISRRTLQRAGFAPVAHIIVGSLAVETK